MAIRADLVAAFPNLTLAARQATTLLLNTGETLKFARGQVRVVATDEMVELPSSGQFNYVRPGRDAVLNYLTRLPNLAVRPRTVTPTVPPPVVQQPDPDPQPVGQSDQVLLVLL